MAPPVSCQGSEVRLPGGQVLAEYVWVGHTGSDLRSKTRVLRRQLRDVSDLPPWYCDSPVDASGAPGLVQLQPRRVVSDPFRGGENVLVLCDTFLPARHRGHSLAARPHPTNNRAPCELSLCQ